MTCYGFLLDLRALLIFPLFFSHLPMTITLPPLCMKALTYYSESKSQTIVTAMHHL